MEDTNHSDLSNNNSNDIEKSDNVPSPENPRRAVPCESYYPDSPQMKSLFDRFACVKNSTFCNEKDNTNNGTFSDFLPSGYLSPIQPKASVTYTESIDSESMSSNSARFCMSSNTSDIPEKNISNLQYSPIIPQLPNLSPKMSTLPEVTEPLSSNLRELSLESNKQDCNGAVTDLKISSTEKTSDPTYITPKILSYEQTFDVSKRTAHLLLAPYIAGEYESSDEDNLECPPQKPPPPIMCMSRTQEQEVNYENFVLNMSMKLIESDSGLKTADKSTQTFAELGVPALYYSPRGDPNAHRLKEWMNKIFDSKLPELNS